MGTPYQLSSVSRIIDQGGWGPNELNTSVGESALGDGLTMKIGGRAFSHGIGTHAASVISFDLEAKCSSFQSWLGVDDEVGNNGQVAFRVYIDGAQAFDSGIMTGADPAKFTGSIPISGVTELMLVVDVVGQEGDWTYGSDHADWAEPLVVCTSRPNGNGDAVKHIRGSWGPVMSWPVKAIHAALLPSGHIVSHASVNHDSIAGNDPNLPHDYTTIDLADTRNWNHQWIDHPREEMYCSAHTLLPDGSLFEFGGHSGGTSNYFYYGRKQASIFDFDSKTWINQADMAQARWYTTGVTLGNGHVLAIGGSNAGGNIFVPEIFDGTNWRTLANVNYQNRLNNNEVIFDHTYPFVHLVSDGRVLWAGWDETMSFIDVNGNGSWSQNYKREDLQRAWGASVLYNVDKILMVGGVDHKGSYGGAARSAVTIDVTGGSTPQISKASPMLFPRADADGTVLANGEVFMNGGGYYHVLGPSPTHVFVPETWNPDTGEWTVGAQAANPRGYHSTTLLLPDGRVWTAGGECGNNCPDGMTAQVYTPPYLYKKDGSGSLASRPVINNVKTPVAYGEEFEVSVSGGDIGSSGVGKVTLIRLGSTTHHINFEQRYIELDSVLSGTNSLILSAPANGNIAPPGFYMLFVFDGAGVPSEAKMVQLATGNPVPPPPSPTAPVAAPTTLANSPTSSCNLLVNGNIEAALSGWSDNGDISPSSDATEGSLAMSISNGWTGQRVANISPGQTYVLTGMYKTVGFGGWTGVGINFMDSNGVQIAENANALNESGSYTSFTASHIAPAGAAQIQVWLYRGGTAIMLVDGLELKRVGCTDITTSAPVTKPVAAPAPVTAPTNTPMIGPAACNLLENGSVEGGLSGWSDNGDLSLSSDATEGSSAVSISNGWTGQRVANISPGQTYVLSGMYKTVGSGGWTGVGINFLDSNGVQIAENANALREAGSYTSFAASHVAPASAAEIQVWLYRGGTSAMLVDGLELKRADCS